MAVPHFPKDRIRVLHESRLTGVEPEGHDYWPNFRFRSLISFAHLSASVRMTCAKSSGEPGRISRPMPSNFATRSGSASARPGLALIFVTVGAGVRAGSRSPHHVPTTHTGTPDSATVGI